MVTKVMGDVRTAGVTTRRLPGAGLARRVGLGVATGVLALGLFAGAGFAGAQGNAATVGVELAGTRVGTAPGQRESTVDGARADTAIDYLEPAGVRVASSPTSREST